MNLKHVFILIVATIMVSCNQQKNIKIVTVEDSVAYSIGMMEGEKISQGIAQNKALDTVLNKEILSSAYTNAIQKKKSKLTKEQAEDVMKRYFTKMREEQQASATTQKAGQEKDLRTKSTEYIATNVKYLEDNKKKAGVKTTASGLQYKVLRKGWGKKPVVTDKVKCHYAGTVIDGTEFDSSYKRKKPATFPLNGVIKGWTEGLQLMKEGAKYRFFIPEELAYGANMGRDQSIIKPFSTLIFEVELIKIEK